MNHRPDGAAIWPLVLFLLVLLIGGCTSLPPDVERPGSEAVEVSDQTGLGKLALQAAQAYQAKSGFIVQETGRAAFLQRAALIEAAERSIDAQYYIWNSDNSGRYLARRLLLAADTGRNSVIHTAALALYHAFSLSIRVTGLQDLIPELDKRLYAVLGDEHLDNLVGTLDLPL